MTPAQAQALIQAVAKWVESRPDLKALAVAGSWSRGTAKDESDLDLIILADDPVKYRTSHDWVADIPLPACFQILSRATEDYGAVWSCRAFLSPAAELELSFGAPSWAHTDPIDPGTQRVAGDGLVTVIDKDGLLARLQIVVATNST